MTKKGKTVSVETTTGPELSQELLDFIEEWKEKKGNLIMILHKAQQQYGYVPWELASRLSEAMNVPLAKILGVLTFYHYFKLNKPGRHKLAVCMGTACYLKGAQDLIEELGNLLDIGVDETTEDGEFSLESVRCVGCCGLAPVLMVDDEVFGKLKTDGLAGILAKFRGVDTAAHQ
jgi:NADH:ubiquinone oxidoreductase subunit E